MKRSLIALTVTSLTFGFAACDKKAPEAAAPAAASSSSSSTATPAAESAAPAVPAAPAVDPKAAFTENLNKLADEMNALKQQGGSPSDMLKKLPELQTKLEAVPTTGLPADVVTSFEKAVKDSKAMMEILAKFPSDLPSDPAAIPAYMQANPDAAKTMMEVQTQLQTKAVESKAVQEEFKAAAEKHGIDVTKFVQAGEG